MSLRVKSLHEIPQETQRVAKAVLPKGNRYMQMRDTLRVMFEDQAFATLFAVRGQPAISPAELALVTVMQFAEGLSDRQAAEAVRVRIDWKYALGLELTDPGFDASVLTEFRARLVGSAGAQLIFDQILEQCRTLGLVKPRGKQRTDSTHVLGAVRAINRLECVGEAMRHALNDLARVAPDWLRIHIQPEWLERYGPRVDDYRLPKSKQKREAHAVLVGQDGMQVLQAALTRDAPVVVRSCPALDMLRRIWIQNFVYDDGMLRWRSNKDIPKSACFVASPYDGDAHYARKGDRSWVGYKVHLTEACDTDAPRIITQVTTTSAPVADGDVVEPIHQALRQKDLLPKDHIVDTGYVSAKLLVNSYTTYQVNLVGPARSNYHWQAQAASGYAVDDFAIQWDQQCAICPQGKTSVSWTPALDSRANEVIKIKFSMTDCRECKARLLCTRAKRTPRRTLTLRLHERYLALKASRIREQTASFKTQYALRAGIEGTMSRALRQCDLRRTRYRGFAKTHLQHVMTAAAMNVMRATEWLTNIPIPKTQRSAYQRLCATLS